MDASSTASSRTLEPLFALLSYSFTQLETTFYKLPGSHVVARYARASHQNDPGRTLVEVLIFAFLVFTILQQRTRGGDNEKQFIKFSEKEIDELVDDWVPEPLGAPLTEAEQAELASVPVVVGPNGPKPKLLNSTKPVLNFASYNFTGLAGNEVIRDKAIDILRQYGLGSCGPPGFYGTFDVHMELERNIADFLGTESAILYSQSFSTISSVIPAFAKRHDIIVADRGVNFAIQKGLQISRSTVRWFDHNDPRSLEDVLLAVEKERKKRRAPLTRRFIVTEGIFEKDGAMVDLPKVIELKKKYKFRLILDESVSFGTVGRTGRGLTELYNVPASEVDILVGSVASGLNAAGGFCAGSRVVTEHQRINGTSFVFSAALPPLLAVSASEGINILRNTPSLLATLRENIAAVRGVLDKVEGIDIPSHPASPIIHIMLRPTPTTTTGLLEPTVQRDSPLKSNPLSVHPRDGSPTFDTAREEKLLQEIVDECLAQGVWLTRAKRLRGQELVEARPSIRVAVTAALSKKECERAAGVVKGVVGRVVGRRR